MTAPGHAGAAAPAVMDAAALAAFMSVGFGRPWTWPIEVHDAGVSLTCPAEEQTVRPGGTVSGPTLMTLADSAAYLVILSRVGPEALAVTTSLSINFLRRPEPGDLTAEARLLKLGRTLCVADVVVRSGSPGRGSDIGAVTSDAVAHATVTYSRALVGTAVDRTDATGATLAPHDAPEES